MEVEVVQKSTGILALTSVQYYALDQSSLESGGR